jgi:CBS domain-containing protein
VLFRGNLDAVEIGRIVSTVNDAATVRMIHLAQSELEETLGSPPCPYAWIVHGSEGRREQALLTDQDNAIVYRDATEEAARYFAELGRRVTEGLQKLGLPACPGGFMADGWHKPLADWQELFRSWIETPGPQALIDAANFFDHRPVWGDLDLEPLEQVLRSASRQKRFLAHMAKNALDFKPPIGVLRRIRQAAEGVDLKRGGIIPIVSLGRLAALEAGSAARGTIDRLEAGRQDGELSPEGAETLAEAFRFLLRLRLEHQLQARKTGRPVDNRVQLDELSPLERRHLKDAFAAIRDVQGVVEHRWGVAMLG